MVDSPDAPKQGSDSDANGLMDAPWRRLTAWTRFLMLIPVVGLFFGSVTLVSMAGVEVYRTILEAIGGHLEKKLAVLKFIELADVFLLATVLYIMAMGLFELFIDDRLPVPNWLEVHTLDDLKEKLVGVVVVVLAVSFLGKVIEAQSARDLMELGVGVAAVIAALSYFLGRIGHK
ncbi:MAG: YqhA family protein [Coriobacteriia bacterium]|nr:YqhA family protein [Coriobacteriia bacterium]MDO9108958.1 YqhA family protein [Coriobacteriia bacterium]